MTAREPREYCPGYLEYVRQQPCCITGSRPVEACHIRMSAHGKRNTGLQEKPHDRHCVPMTPEMHRLQHSMSESAFWNAVKLDPFVIASRLYAEYLAQGGKPGKPRGPRKIKARKPREQRSKVPKGKKLQSANRWPKRNA